MAVNEVVAMRHEPFTSVEEFLAPDVLSALVDAKIDSVRRLPFTGGSSASGSSFLAVETNDGQGPRFVVKLSSPACDWIVRATGDEHGREVSVWASGLLDRLPPEIVHPVIACARDESGWAILMRDVGSDLIPDPMGDSPISRADHRRYLDALAALHVAFWDEPACDDSMLGFCSLTHMYTSFSPEIGRRESSHPNEAAGKLAVGWDLFWPLVDPDVADLLLWLFDDPAPLCKALSRYPRTVVHGDPREANLGLTHAPVPRVVLIDWHFASLAPPGLDMAWYAFSVAIRRAIPPESTVALSRDLLARRLGARFDEEWWRPQMALCLLGQVMRTGWFQAWDIVHNPNPTARARNRQELVWWSERAREGTRWL